MVVCHCREMPHVHGWCLKEEDTMPQQTDAIANEEGLRRCNDNCWVDNNGGGCH